MDLPDDAEVLMVYFKKIHSNIDKPCHLPEMKGGPAVLIGGRHCTTGQFFHVTHSNLRAHRDHYSIENEYWWGGGNDFRDD